MKRVITFHYLLRVTQSLTVKMPPLLYSVDAETYREPATSTVVIPGSTIKGVWRTASCYAARVLGLTCCGTKNPEKMIERHRNLESTIPYVDAGKENTPLCHVCAVFGSVGVSGVVLFSDAEPLLPPLTTVKPGVEIDDYTGRAAEGKLYFAEAIVPTNLFTFRVDILEPATPIRGGDVLCWAVKLVAAASEYVEAVGVGSGSAKPYLWRIDIHGDDTTGLYTDPENAARAVASKISSCDEGELRELFSRIWLPRRNGVAVFTTASL